MYLEKLEIHGFKSFGDSVKLQIPQGITAVIGPNGSGKSNVADAIRWVLGEQSAKTLRGTKMEDIIFAGTEKRKSLGYAEVAMQINNQDRKLPIDYKEVQIKRRVYRSGESEYFINQSLCRLKDIQELFMDTGVGKEGYSIIGQGQIDKVLSSKPEDRRSLFEEAAGIYKYKIRRQEAERKLEKERDNILRIHDIMCEIESRLAPLEKEAEKTKMYLSLKDTLKEVEINAYIGEINRIKESLTQVEGHLENLDTEINENKSQKDRIAQIQKNTKEQREKLFQSVQDLLQKTNDLEKQQQQKKSDITLNQERILSIEQLEDQIQKDTKKQLDYRQGMQNELQVLQAKKRGLELEEASKKNKLMQLEQDFELKQQQLETLENTIKQSKEELYAKIRERDILASTSEKQGVLEEETTFRKNQLQEKIAHMNTEVAHQEVELKVKTKKMSELKETLEALSETLKKENVEKIQRQNALTKVKHEVSQLHQDQQQNERQLQWLLQIKNDFEGYFHSVKQILTLKKKEPEKWTGIIGATADLLSVPEKYETAIVTALGGAMQHIVTRTERDAKLMIGVMKEKGIGKATFLPLDTLQAHPLKTEKESMKKEQGFLGLASELIHYAEAYQPVANYLLGRILVVDTLDNGSKLARKYHYKYKIVTLEGEVFNVGGSLSGGSTKNNKNNIFARSREIKTLQDKKIALEKKYATCYATLEKLTQEDEEKLKVWDDLQETLDIKEAEEKALFVVINTLSNSLELTKQSQLQLVEEKYRLEELLQKAKEDQVNLKQTIEAMTQDLNNEEHEVNTLEESLRAYKEIHDTLRSRVTEQKIALSQTIQNQKHIEEQLLHVHKNIENTKEQHISIQLRQEQLKEDKEKLKNEIVELYEAIEAIEARLVEAEGKKQTYETEKEALGLQEEKIQVQLNEITERSEKLQEERYRLIHKIETLKSEEQKQNDSIWEHYELTYSQCLPFKQASIDLGELRKRADYMRAKIKAIGHINVNAVAEYEETQTRYQFLKTQREDIEKAEQTLVELINTLTQQMHAIFKEQFTAIAANFSQVFQELFGGGLAFLQLVDEENILESGIEIIAKPPGKKLQNMTLLSGGERTLTAIALLFGILKLKPSPFCVLDEIEAALDDANVLRFASYLNSLSQETQFVVITHRKGTMEHADTLYGVTMQERGVSTVLSIKLEEATQYLDQKTS